MGNKYYTILAIPQGKGSIRKIRISATLLSFISILIITALLSICYLSYSYVETRADLKKLAGLERLTSLQRDRLDFLASKVSDFEKKMMHLAQFDKKIRVMTNLDNDHNGGEMLGVGGPVSGEDQGISRAAEVESALIDRIHENMDELLDETALQRDSFAELLDFLGKQKSILASTPSIWPVIGWTTSEFGYRVSPFTGKREFHRGIDIAAEIGKEIVAPADGLVSKVLEERGMGNLVQINHGNGVITVYGHLLKKGSVKRGQTVKRGDIIGYIGNSGRSTGPHLHYGVCENGIYINPRRYLF
ncbi:MAG: M23 family metallopeptidase [Deltaproteobacteria bacterium]|nr:M23 family metallopeptidase [Deltaproteobacteria bacterium]MBW2674387.1 M23 family metallopeptidase [Deltaproteobacteria bacterium]